MKEHRRSTAGALTCSSQGHRLVLRHDALREGEQEDGGNGDESECVHWTWFEVCLVGGLLLGWSRRGGLFIRFEERWLRTTRVKEPILTELLLLGELVVIHTNGVKIN